jgi:hypothetical protein
MKLNSVKIIIISLLVGLGLTYLSGFFHSPSHTIWAVVCYGHTAENHPVHTITKGLPLRYYKTDFYLCKDSKGSVLVPGLIADTALYTGIVFATTQILRKKKR